MCPVIFLVFLSWLQNSYNSYKHYFFLQPQLKHVVEGVGGASGISHLLPPNSEGRKDPRSPPHNPRGISHLSHWLELGCALLP